MEPTWTLVGVISCLRLPLAGADGLTKPKIRLSSRSDRLRGPVQPRLGSRCFPGDFPLLPRLAGVRSRLRGRPLVPLGCEFAFLAWQGGAEDASLACEVDPSAGR